MAPHSVLNELEHSSSSYTVLVVSSQETPGNRLQNMNSKTGSVGTVVSRWRMECNCGVSCKLNVRMHTLEALCGLAFCKDWFYEDSCFTFRQYCVEKLLSPELALDQKENQEMF
jgi:hypothetical protein